MKYSYNEASKTLVLETKLVTEAEVRRVCAELETEGTATQVADFINTAHLIVVEQLDGWGISAPRLKEIEKYLAAHFGAITFPVAAFESVGKVQASYQQKVALDFRFTKYGQMALSLDPTGQLDDTKTKGKTYSITWLGQTQADWEAQNGVNQ